MKIGILTMHKVLNYGSALQAYALQHYISKLGYDAELIDYIFPNGARKERMSLIRRIFSPLRKIMSGRLIKEQKFRQFYKDYFVCSKNRYESPEKLAKAELDYDIFMTGSDQVWNPQHIKDDRSFFFPFVPENSKKISYASSFSVAHIPEAEKAIYRDLLGSYNAISVREKSGVQIVEELTGKEAEMVCDPTLLIDKAEWSDMVKNMPKPYPEPYILAYILRYSYDPYPEINNIIDTVQNRLGHHLIILDGSFNDIRRKNATVIKNAGPLEFINLVKNASFIITTSFHGTAFALNFGIPFYSVIKDRSGFDTRMTDLLDKIGCSDRAIMYNEKIFSINLSNSFGTHDFVRLSQDLLRQKILK